MPVEQWPSGQAVTECSPSKIDLGLSVITTWADDPHLHDLFFILLYWICYWPKTDQKDSVYTFITKAHMFQLPFNERCWGLAVYRIFSFTGHAVSMINVDQYRSMPDQI